MTSDSVAGILGWIVAAVVLVMAVIYGPIGQFRKAFQATCRGDRSGCACRSGRPEGTRHP